MSAAVRVDPAVMGRDTPDGQKTTPAHCGPGALRRGGLVAGMLALIVGAALGGYALGATGAGSEAPPVPDELAMAGTACRDLAAPAAALATTEIIDAATVSVVETLVAALPDDLVGEGATVLGAYRAIAEGDLAALGDAATAAEAALAADAISSYLLDVCGVEIG